MDPDLVSGLCLFGVMGACLAASIFWGNLSWLTKRKLRDPVFANYWEHQIWWNKFGLSASLGCVVFALLALLAWG